MKRTKKEVAGLLELLKDGDDRLITDKTLSEIYTDLLSAMDALKFYSNESNYEWLIGMDNGAKAREVLNE